MRETATVPWNLVKVVFGDWALSLSALVEWYRPFKSNQEL
jgi:hypothetical protein